MNRMLVRAALAVAAALVLPVQARDLPQVDALASAPRAASAARAKAAQADSRFMNSHFEDRLGVPTLLWMSKAPAAAKATGGSPESAARAHLKAYASLYKVSAAEIDAATLHHVDRLAKGATLAKFTNQRDGIEVFRESVAVLMNSSLQPIAIGGYIGPTQLSTSAKSVSLFNRSPAQAIATAMSDYGFGASIASQLTPVANFADAAAGYQRFHVKQASAEGAYLSTPARAKRVWFRMPEGLVPAYYVELQMADPKGGTIDYYAYVIAADDGRVLFRNNQTADAQSYTYRVWAETTGANLPFVGPQGRNGTPHPTGVNDGYQAPYVPSNLLTLQNGPISTNDPWLPDNATQTTGNNVEAWANHTGVAVVNGNDPSDRTFNPDPAECDFNAAQTADFHACVTAANMFDHTFDPTLAPAATKHQAMGAVVQMFYMNNWLHDWYYDAGFREIDGNAQSDNLGRGGIAGDSIQAQGQDYEGTSNANMSTPSDGGRPRMRMYVFPGGGNANVVVTPAGGSPSNNAATVSVGWGPTNFDLTRNIVQAIDLADTTGPSTTDGCTALTNAAAVAGNIALIDRGTCTFITKVKNAQNAGAVGVIIANSAAGSFANLGGGPDNTITIPALMVTFAEGNAIKTSLSGGAVSAEMQRVSGNDRDGTVDDSIMAHEWGHYISNRLVHDSNGLVTNQSRGMGEGWADFHALLMMVKAEDTAVPSNSSFNGVYTVGSYALDGPQIAGVTQSPYYYYGIRRYPYSSDMSKNPLQYQHIVTGAALPASPPPAFTGDNAEVHNAGEVWASMLWSCYSNILRDTLGASPRLTFAQAQDNMKRYLVAGYKLTPIAPTLVEARDAILSAIAATGPQEDLSACANAFAQRGLGLRAKFTGDRYSATNAGVIPSNSAGNDIDITTFFYDSTSGLYCDADTFLDNGESGTLRVVMKNVGSATLNTPTVTLTSNSGPLTITSANPVNVGTLAPGATATAKFTVALNGGTAVSTASVTASVNDPDMSVGPATANFTLPVQRDLAPATSASDDVEDPATMWTATFNSGTTDPALQWRRQEFSQYDHRWSAPTGASRGAVWLTSPVLQVGATSFSMSFSHRFAFENGGTTTTNFDGGVIEVSTDNGTTWTDIETVLGAQSVYNGNLASGTPLGARRAFVHDSATYPAMAPITITFPASMLNQSVRIRFGAATDTGGNFGGWDLDDFSFTGINNTPFSGYVGDAHACVSVSAFAGTPQSTNVNAAFPNALKLKVLAGLNPVVGASVSFNAPNAGASGLFGASATATATTDAQGIATAPTFTANGLGGSYDVTGAAGTGSAPFHLTNVAPPNLTGLAPSPLSVAVGETGTLTLTLAQAQLTTTTITLGAAPGGIVSVPVSIDVPAGNATVDISVTGVAAGDATVTATFGSSHTSALVHVTPGVPGAPTGLSATAGNGQATFTFTAPASTGTSAITGYTVTCNPGTHTGSGAASPVTVNGLTNGTTYTCSVAATNSAGPGAASATTTVTPGVGHLQASVTSLAFGAQSLGTTSASLTVTLTNDGGADVALTPAIQVSGPFAQSNNCPSTLTPGQSCTVTVTFSPPANTAIGTVNGTLAASGTLTAGPAGAISLSGVAEKSLVVHYYRSILGRSPDQAGHDFWQSEAARVAALGANINETWYALAMTFYGSAEYAALQRDNTGYLTDLYRTFFNRAPDSGGLNFWLTQMAGGMPRETVLVQFLFSPEFGAFTQAIFGNTAVRGEVDLTMDFYRGALGRLPDSGGFNFFLGQFRTAQCSGANAVRAEAESVSHDFVNSPEYGARNRTNAQYVSDLYNAFLRRGADLAGVDFWIQQLDTHAQTREQVRAAFVGSAEFSNRVTAVVNAGCQH